MARRNLRRSFQGYLSAIKKKKNFVRFFHLGEFIADESNI